jgi:hypothetical protein
MQLDKAEIHQSAQPFLYLSNDLEMCLVLSLPHLWILAAQAPVLSSASAGSWTQILLLAVLGLQPQGTPPCRVRGQAHGAWWPTLQVIPAT